jgi:hypothetical protein
MQTFLSELLSPFLPRRFTHCLDQDYCVHYHILRRPGTERYQESNLLLYRNIFVGDYWYLAWVSHS